jgi:hypothetical protein
MASNDILREKDVKVLLLLFMLVPTNPQRLQTKGAKY